MVKLDADNTVHVVPNKKSESEPSEHAGCTDEQAIANIPRLTLKVNLVKMSAQIKTPAVWRGGLPRLLPSAPRHSDSLLPRVQSDASRPDKDMSVSMDMDWTTDEAGAALRISVRLLLAPPLPAFPRPLPHRLPHQHPWCALTTGEPAAGDGCQRPCARPRGRGGPRSGGHGRCHCCASPGADHLPATRAACDADGGDASGHDGDSVNSE